MDQGLIDVLITASTGGLAITLFTLWESGRPRRLRRRLGPGTHWNGQPRPDVK